MKTFRLLHVPIVDHSSAFRSALRRSRPNAAVVGGSSRPGWLWRRTQGRSYASVWGRRGSASLERGCQKVDVKPDLFVAYEVTAFDGAPLAIIGIDAIAPLTRDACEQLIDLISDLRDGHRGIEFVVAGLLYDSGALVRDLFDFFDCSWLNEGDSWVAASEGLTVVDWSINRPEVHKFVLSSIEVDLTRVR